MAGKNGQINSEIQDVYGKLVNVQTVAEDSLKLSDFIPARRNLVVEPIPPDTVTKGGLVIPEAAKTDKSVGWAVAVHPDDKEYAIGDLIYFRFGAGQQIRIEGRDVVVLQYFSDSFGDILGHWPRSQVRLLEDSATKTA